MPTWQSILGPDAVERQVHGSTTDAVRVNADNPRSATEPVPRVSGEYADQASPASDQRRGGLPGASVDIDLNTEVDHDGYGGRGDGKKDVSAKLADR